MTDAPPNATHALLERCIQKAFDDPAILADLEQQFLWALRTSFARGLKTELRELFLSEARAALSRAVADYLKTHSLDVLLVKAAGEVLSTYGVRDLMRTRRATAKLTPNPPSFKDCTEEVT